VGAVPTVADSKARPRSARETAEAVVTLWRRMSLDRDRLAEQVVITPACGLAGLSPQDARTRLELCREAARIGPEMITEGAAE
jgi:methionine synthase II (cobalamin-independent)